MALDVSSLNHDDREERSPNLQREALHKGLITGGQPARKLKEQPVIIKSLQEYNRSVQQIPRMGIRVRPLTSALVAASEAIRVQEG